MTRVTGKAIPKLRNAPQPPLSYPGATPDSNRAKKPPLADPPAADEKLSPGDRVEGLGNSESQLEKSAQLSELTKRTQWSSGMMTDARESANRRSRRFTQ
jgi:hypothetical protein